ncbi:MAG TPA: hypothetical protein VMK42_19535 [Anaeromyxobacteraceae bacterium]|nr:hypothetical protein [Anaeromyxobacteraceae bacterium]
MQRPTKAPGSIHTASLFLLLAASVQAGVALVLSATSTAGFSQWLFAVVVMALLLWGIFRGYRLAWLWGRHLAFVLSAVVLAMVLLGLYLKKLPFLPAAVMLFGLVLPLAVVAVSLGRTSARQWFDLYCPKCGSGTSRGKDFLFRRARCLKCGEVW